MDTANRDSLACDLMEVIRPDVDQYVLDWIARRPLKRSWFFEERNGNCRLMAELASQLAETCQTWARPSFAPARRKWTPSVDCIDRAVPKNLFRPLD